MSRKFTVTMADPRPTSSGMLILIVEATVDRGYKGADDVDYTVMLGSLDNKFLKEAELKELAENDEVAAAVYETLYELERDEQQKPDYDIPGET